MKSYVSDTRTVFLASLAGAVAALGAQAYLAWCLLPAGRGEYAACLLFATVLIMACALGQEMANVYYLGSKGLTVSEAMTQSLAVGAVVSLVASAGGYLLTLISLPFLEVAPLRLFRIALVCVPATIFHLYLSRVLLGMAEVRKFTFINVAPQLLMLLGLSIGAFIGLTVEMAILVQAGSNAALAAVAVWLLVRRHGARLVRINASSLRRSLHYGLRFCLGKLCSLVNGQMGTIILAALGKDAREVGLFAAGAALASRVWLMAEAMQTALLPRSAIDPGGESTLVAQSVRLCLAVCGVATLVIGLLAKPIIMLVLSPEFLPILVPFWVLLPGVVIRIVSKILPAYFNGMNRPQITSVAMGITLLANVGLMYVLLPMWGLAGVALAMSIAYTLEAIFMAIAFRHVSGLPISSLVRFTADDWRALRRAAHKALGRSRAEGEG